MTGVTIHPRGSLIGLALVSAAVLTGGSLAPASAREWREGHRGACRTSLEASSSNVAVGEIVTLSGQLTCSDGASPGDVALTFFERQRGVVRSSAMSEVGTASTEPDGSFKFTTPALSANCVFVVRPAGGRAARLAVKVAPKVTLTEPVTGAQLATRGGHAGPGNRWTFTGTVEPAVVGAHVALQRQYPATGEGWHTVAVGHVGPEGHFSITHGFRSPGAVNVRVVVRIKGDLSTASEPLGLDVLQAQNPRLTIEPSADPLGAGQTLTITGIAAGASPQSVTLLARSGGQRFLPVAKAETEANGDYTFTVSPERRTYYRVSDASTHSTVLLERFS
jgi:hypothetical protein